MILDIIARKMIENNIKNIVRYIEEEKGAKPLLAWRTEDNEKITFNIVFSDELCIVSIRKVDGGINSIRFDKIDIFMSANEVNK